MMYSHVQVHCTERDVLASKNGIWAIVNRYRVYHDHLAYAIDTRHNGRISLEIRKMLQSHGARAITPPLRRETNGGAFETFLLYGLRTIMFGIKYAHTITL